MTRYFALLIVMLISFSLQAQRIEQQFRLLSTSVPKTAASGSSFTYTFIFELRDEATLGDLQDTLTLEGGFTDGQTLLRPQEIKFIYTKSDKVGIVDVTFVVPPGLKTSVQFRGNLYFVNAIGEKRSFFLPSHQVDIYY